MKLGSVMIGSEDPGTLSNFYTKVLGKPAWDADKWYGFDCGGSYLMLGPHSEVKGHSKEPQRIILNFVSDNVQSDFKRVKGLGAIIIAEPYQPDKDSNPDTWITTFAGPDGNYFQFSTPWKS